MTDKRIYSLPVPQDAQTRDRQEGRTEVSRLGVLTEGQPVAKSTGTDPDNYRLEGEYRGEYARLMAYELEDLFTNGSIETVPFYKVDNDGNQIKTNETGYYAPETASVSPADPRGEDGTHYQWELTMVRKGTANDFYRMMSFDPSGRADHEFGNDLTGYVGVPAAAEQVVWWDEDDGSRSVANPTETVSGEYGAIDRYNVDDVSSYTDPRLLYSLDLQREGRMDLSVWDDRGHDSKLDSDGIPHWFQVFSTSHEAEGKFIVTNEVIRLKLNDRGGSLTADRWDDDNSQWSAVGLSEPSTVSLFDTDITRIGMGRVEGQLTFNVDGTLFALNFSLSRGDSDVLFALPDDQNGPIPDALESWLNPIASTSIARLGEVKGLVARNEVRR